MTPQEAAALRDKLLDTLNADHKGMCAVIEHVPDEKLTYTPHDGLRPFAELAHHIYGTNLWFGGIMKAGKAEFGETPTVDVPTTKAALLDACNGMHEQMLGLSKSLSGEQLAKPIAFFNYGEFPAVTFLEWSHDHLIHHRGQLTTYLRIMGAKVPALMGDSIDYPLSM